MNPADPILAFALMAGAMVAVAALYGSVGHGGASGYLAVMALAGLAPAVMKPTALALNLVVSALAAFAFWRAGHGAWRLFWPFALGSVPFAFLGGFLRVPAGAFHLLVALALLCAALRLAWPSAVRSPLRDLPRAPAIVIGAGLGLLSGFTGVGGGIYLSPILLLARWADAKDGAALSALFILVNSAAALSAHLLADRAVPSLALSLAPFVLLGGALGAWLGTQRLSSLVIRRGLAGALALAGVKLVFPLIP
jgi:uncharacterized membrane protein YfcA